MFCEVFLQVMPLVAHGVQSLDTGLPLLSEDELFWLPYSETGFEEVISGCSISGSSGCGRAEKAPASPVLSGSTTAPLSGDPACGLWLKHGTRRLPPEAAAPERVASSVLIADSDAGGW